MLRLWRHLFGIFFVLLIASCSGGGCSSGCSGCGTTPLPNGFVRSNAMDNAASVRVTRSGLDFLAANIPSVASQVIKAKNGVVTFEIPKSKTTQSFIGINVDITICRNGPNANNNPPECIAEINIKGMKLHMDAITPHSLKITGTVPVRLQDLPMNASVIGDFEVGLGSGGCNGGTPKFDYKDFPVQIEIPLIKETRAPREGYTKIDGDNAVINVGIGKGDVSICKDCGIISGVCDAVLNFVKDQAFNSLIGGITGQLKDTIKTAFCTKADPAVSPTCPVGSHDDGKGTCVFDGDAGAGACVPMELGTDGHMDLGAALASFSPGTAGGLDFGLAAGGDMDPAPDKPADDVGYAGHTPNGMTLAFLGGTLPQPQSACVPHVDNPTPTGIPIPDEMVKDTQAPWPATDPTGPHLGIALAGRFLNHALGSAYNSGVLCLGISTEQVAQLNSGLLSALIPSLKKLTFEKTGAPVAITTRPQQPPNIVIGGGTDIKKDPLLLVNLPKFNIDFYVWSDDRFVRTFTMTADLSVPINLQTGKDPKKNPNGGLLPVLGDIGLKNATVSNAGEMLTDDPVQIGAALSSIIQGFAGQALGGGLKPIDISTALKSLGLALTIPDGGIRKLHKGNDDFLAIFADLATQPAAAIVESDTTARLVGKTVHAEAMGLATASDDKLPELRVDLGASADDVEYTWWIDEGTHSAWSTEKNLTIKDRYLFLQGKHVLYVSSRVKGQPDTEDATPAEVPYTIDTLAPYVRVTRIDDENATLEARDIVSATSALRGRTRTTNAAGEASAWTDWRPVTDLAKLHFSGAHSIDVEVADEEGNVASTSQALIRGHGDTTLSAGGSGCGCSTPGSSAASKNGPAALLVVAGALLYLALRRRRVHPGVMGLGALCVVAATTEGCACGSSDGGDDGKTHCGTDCNSKCQDPLPMGLVGAYTSVAKAKDGTVWVAGYNEEYAPPTGEPSLYGDLVVGKYDKGKQQVAWITVDGLPAPRTDGTCADSAPSTWRGGEVEPADDVGLWTTTALDGNDNPMVAYFDATHTALKFASCGGGCDDPHNWSSHVVAQKAGSDMGRYAKMLVVSGNPVVAHLVMEPGNAGKIRTKVVLARATNSSPKSTADWTMETVTVDENGPCRASLCSSDQVCVKDTESCQAKVTGCTPVDCGTGNACVTIANKATCSAVISDASAESYPKAIGDYISMAVGPSGLGIVLYDRIHGNLLGVQSQGGGWKTAILDGETGTRGKDAKDTGDDGVGASLFIDSKNNWHVTYVNGITETLNYLVAPGGANPKPEPIDDGDGAKVDGKPFPDGKHVVGDDSFVTADEGGNVTVVYQDATAGTLRVANGAPQGGPHKWTIKVVSQPNKFAGYFPHPIPGQPDIANWFRSIDPASKETTGDVSFVTP
jgi:MYXO-CTERM domain-containing protein